MLSSSRASMRLAACQSVCGFPVVKRFAALLPHAGVLLSRGEGTRHRADLRQTRIHAGASPALSSTDSSGADVPKFTVKQPKFGIFVGSGSPGVAEALSVCGLDWICVDMQHGPVGYEQLAHMLRACNVGRGTKVIVRVGGPTDRFGIQQALDLGADGVMVPLVNTRAEAEAAVSYCLYPPEGQRSAVYPSRAMYRQYGFGGTALTSYMRDANKAVDVWLQVESAESLKNIDDILSVPGITCAFLGPADMALTMGLHKKYNYDLAATLSCAEIAPVYDVIVEDCRKHKVAPGVFCLGAARAIDLAAKGYSYIAYDVDLNILTNYAAASLAQLRPAAASALLATLPHPPFSPLPPPPAPSASPPAPSPAPSTSSSDSASSS